MLKKELFKDEAPLKRRQILEDNCVEPEKITYPSQFTEEEMGERKTELANIDLDIQSMDDEKKAFMQLHKDRMKPLNERKKSLLKDLKRGYEEVTDTCYKFIDDETNTIGYYNGNGDLVKEQPCGKHCQKSMFEDMSSTGTEG